MSRIALSIVASFLVAALPPSAAANCYDYAGSPRQVGLVDTPGSAKDVATLGAYAYVADSSDLLRVVDVSDPSAPAIVASVTLSGAASAVTVEGTFAYVATSNGLQVVDLANPALPVARGIVPTTAAATDVAASGTVVYVGLGSPGFDVIDASVPTAPVLVATVPGNAEQLATDGPRLATTAGWQHVARFYDISSPQAPSLLGLTESYPEFPEMHNLLAPVVSGETLQLILWSSTYDPQTFLTYDWSRLYAVDFTDPSTPVWNTGLYLDEIGLRAVPDGGMLYLLSENTLYSDDSELWILDNADPWSPSVLHRMRVLAPDGGGAVAATPSGPAFLSCAAAAGVRTFDVTNPGEPDWVEALTRYTTVYDVVSIGNWMLYTELWFDGCCSTWSTQYTTLRSCDGSDPEAPVEVGSIAEADLAWTDVAAVSDRIFISGNNNGFWHSTVDLSTGVPGPEAFVATPGTWIRDLTAAGTHLLLAKGVEGLQVYDASASGDPVLVLDTATYPVTSVDADGAVGATVHPSTLRSLDLTDPSAPVFAGSVPAAASEWVVVEGTLAIAGGGTTLEIFDLGNLANPVSLSTIACLDDVEDAAIEGAVLYVTLGQGGLLAVDIADPASPQALGVLATDAAAGLAVHDGYVWVCEGSGLSALPLACTAAAVSSPVPAPAVGTGLIVSPNPFRDGTTIHFTAARGDRIGMRLYDVQGRLVRGLVEGRAAAARSVSWDGRDESGALVAPGIYFVRLDSAKGTETAKVVRVR